LSKNILFAWNYLVSLFLSLESASIKIHSLRMTVLADFQILSQRLIFKAGKYPTILRHLVTIPSIVHFLALVIRFLHQRLIFHFLTEEQKL